MLLYEGRPLLASVPLLSAGLLWSSHEIVLCLEASVDVVIEYKVELGRLVWRVVEGRWCDEGSAVEHSVDVDLQKSRSTVLNKLG